MKLYNFGIILGFVKKIFFSNMFLIMMTWKVLVCIKTKLLILKILKGLSITVSWMFSKYL